MTLRNDYNTALTTALMDVRDAAIEYFGTTILSTIQSDIQAEAAKGNKSFTLTYMAGGNGVVSSDLRLAGPLWDAYKTGVLHVMYRPDTITACAINEPDTSLPATLDQTVASGGDLMFNEVQVNINTTDASQVKVDLVFTF